MDGITTFLNLAGKSFVDFALEMLVQSSLLIIVLLVLELFLRKRVRAVLRYWLWMLILVKLVLPTTVSSPTSIAYWIGDRLPGIFPDKQVAVEEPATITAGAESPWARPRYEVMVFSSPACGIIADIHQE